MTKQSQGLFLFYVVPPMGAVFMLQKNNCAGMEIINPVTQGILQNGILLLTGTVAGEIPGRIIIQIPDGIAEFFAMGIHTDEMESAKKHIRPEPAEDIQQSLVGTAAETVFFSSFFQKKILLMEIVIIGMSLILSDGLAKDTKLEWPQQIVAGTQRDTGFNLQNIIHRDQSGIALQFGIQSDVLFAAEILPESMRVDINRGMIIYFQEPFQTAAVVIVTVRQYAEIHDIQINSQFHGIVREGTGLAGIKQNGPGSGLDQQTQAMLCYKIVPEGGIFN